MQHPEDRPDPTRPEDLADVLTGRRRLLKGGAAALAGAAALRAGQSAAPSSAAAAPKPAPGADRVKGGWIAMNQPKA